MAFFPSATRRHCQYGRIEIRFSQVLCYFGYAFIHISLCLALNTASFVLVVLAEASSSGLSFVFRPTSCSMLIVYPPSIFPWSGRLWVSSCPSQRIRTFGRTRFRSTEKIVPLCQIRAEPRPPQNEKLLLSFRLSNHQTLPDLPSHILPLHIHNTSPCILNSVSMKDLSGTQRRGSTGTMNSIAGTMPKPSTTTTIIRVSGRLSYVAFLSNTEPRRSFIPPSSCHNNNTNKQMYDFSHIVFLIAHCIDSQAHAASTQSTASAQSSASTVRANCLLACDIYLDSRSTAGTSTVRPHYLQSVRT